jgi:phosphohistidine phosphatase
MRRAARGLCRVVPAIDRLVTSPLIRAAQTAEIVAERYAGLEPVEVADWGPAGSPQTVTRWLQAQPANLLIAAVGHEPNLSLCVGWLMARASTPFFAFKKGAACLLEFEGDVDAGAGTLLWALRPSHLRRLGA